jgi:hypothetical protein
MFSVVGDQAVTLSGSFSGDGLEGAEHAGGAAHVVLHLVHASAPGLSEMPPVSKVMPLPTSTTGLPWPCPPCIAGR